jgi:NIMA (never in mitosis gene a)-related kinase
MINNPFYPKISQTEPPKSQLSDFEIQCELGHGSFGIVYKVKRKTDGKIYALKKVYLNQLKEKERQNSLNEIRILASINNKNIIQYKGSFYDNINNSLCLVMEYAENGDLEKKITTRQKKNLYFQEYEILNMIIQIIKGLKSLHDYKIMHRDIKSANIFLFNDNIVKIGDLNVSKILKNNLHNTQTGTPYYASPEIWENKSYDFKSDIWSLGCLIYEICSLKAPFRGTSMKMVYDKVIKGIYDPIPKIYSRALGKIVYICLQVNPNNRPNCEQLLNIIYEQINYFNLGGKKEYNINSEYVINKNDNIQDKGINDG